MSTPVPQSATATATATVTAPEPERCRACTAPLADDQRYCLHCGEIRAETARRPMPAVLGVPVDAHEPAPLRAVPHQAAPDQRPSLAAILAGLACLLLAMGIGVLIGRSGGSDPVAQPTTVAAGPASATAATAAAFSSDWPAGKDGWTIALSQLPKASSTAAAVAAAKTAATAKGAADVGALDSDAYPSLTAGSYVVYSGVFDTQKAATDALTALKTNFPEASVVQVGQSAPASAPSGSSGSTGTAKSKTGSKNTTASDKKASGGDTTKAFEQSKKAPKTVGTGGKAPAKDNKPAAGGAGFQEIK